MKGRKEDDIYRYRIRPRERLARTPCTLSLQPMWSSAPRVFSVPFFPPDPDLSNQSLASTFIALQTNTVNTGLPSRTQPDFNVQEQMLRDTLNQPSLSSSSQVKAYVIHLNLRSRISMKKGSLFQNK